MDYQQTLHYLYNTLPMFSRMGSAALKPNLNNITALCKALGNPQLQFKSIHIGGTNGKGSVSHMLAAVLQTAGYKTGLHTSPHLADFRERIKVNGAMPTEDFVVRFVEKWLPLIEELKPSFFEITVAMAFRYFADQNVDIAIIEVGLGGRLDSTNIITPILSIITNISWDHTNLLGNTLPLIAGEKAGIIKQKVPVVIGERAVKTAWVFEKVAAEKEAPLYFAPDNFSVTQYTLNIDTLAVSVAGKKHEVLKKFVLDLPGIYQTKNLLTVLQAITLLNQNGFYIPDEIIHSALQQVKALTGLHGRWEVLRHNPAVVLEVAHNVGGITQMRAHLAAISYGKLHLILGMVRDKDIETVLQTLPPEAKYYFTQAHIPRALEATVLEQKASAYNLRGDVYETVNNAIQQAINIAAANDLIVVCGSIFLVAEVDRKGFENA